MPPRPNANTNASFRQAEAAPPSPVTRTHPEYYKEGGDLWFLVSDPTPTYFRVGSSFFRDSPDFFALKTSPDAAASDPLPGTGGPERAIIVDETDVDGFAMFLWVFYNPLFDDYSKATLEQWFTILRLAAMWGFPDIKNMALRYITRVIDRDIPDLVQRICKYEEFSAPVETVLPLYVELCSRPTPLTDQEWERLEGLPGHRYRRVAAARELVVNRSVTPTRAADIVRSTLGLRELTATSGAQQAQSSANSATGGGGGSGGGRGGNRDSGGASAGGTGRNTVVVQRPKEPRVHPMSALVSIIISMNLMFFWKLL